MLPQCKLPLPTLLLQILTYSHSVAIPQGGPISSAQCTYTATPCAPPNGPIETITVYEEPFAVTSTRTYDCHGCTAVTVSPKRCFGVGIVSSFQMV